MIFDIDIARVNGVLLIDGRWHEVNEGSLEFVSVTFSRDGKTLYEGEAETVYVRWRDGRFVYYTLPVQQVVAFRYDEREPPKPRTRPEVKR